MPNEQNASNQIGLWLAIGAGVGILLGIVFHNIAMGDCPRQVGSYEHTYRPCPTYITHS